MSQVKARTALIWPNAAWLLGAATLGLLGKVAMADAGEPTDQGRKVYAEHCAACHGAGLEGGAAPALKGEAFRLKWTGKAADELRAALATMPLGSPEALSAEEHRAMFDLLRTENGFAAGERLVAAARDATAAAKEKPVSAPNLPTPPEHFGTTTATMPGDAELASPAPGDWPMYNRDYAGQRYSPLKQINRTNAGRLVPRCVLQLGEVGSFQASPVAYEGRLYLTTAHGTYAVDGATCRKLWEHQHEPMGGEGLANSRGVALYQGKIFRGAPDGWLFALDAETGKLLWRVHATDGNTNHALSAAIAAFDGMVFIGNAGGDRGATGRVYAFDAETGEHRWTFNTVPEPGEFGYETWGGGTYVGGGGMWSTITVDPGEGRLFVPVGNPGSDLDGRMRPGDNLFTNSIVALDARTGKRIWHVQQVPHDVHDRNTAAAPVLYTRDGRRYMAVATKGSWLYLYDRDTRELLSQSETGRHLNAEVAPGDTPVRICPGTLGGTEWNGPGYDPASGLLFVNTVERCATLTRQPEGGKNPFGGIPGYDPPEDSFGWLRAFDAVSGRERWVYRADAPMLAGITPTAGGIVMTGTGSGDFLVFESKTGKVLRRFYTGGAIGGGVSTYLADGEQLVAVATGNSSRSIWKSTGAATLIVFGLPD
ncbi:hypothetical protein MB02_07495 [Croceicoccus estronivorus]|uniref:outer membrane protein assembly factor BamB family protein n=1 Tax=Croceicoccus estronivorus TaxID=1172626 RepID=UPI00082AFD50|nr:PQQ-binding-like beta-propeller repeat protein [Croceicoccus estronivorus]OCC24415.1 hypothetical protein MB02_07495 [Croceicoccus estronivorus]